MTTNQTHLSMLRELSQETGIEDREILEKLLRFDISADNVAALSLVPLFFLGWADGDLDQREDEYIHDYIRKAGISLSGMNLKLISHWFNVPPAREYLDAWSLYMQGKLQSADARTRASMKDEFFSHFERLASVSSGFLGLGPRISRAEGRQLARLRKALSFSRV
jgi:hypothetical protein